MLSRGISLNFNPTRQEIWRQLEAFADDKEIMNYLKGFLMVAKTFNLRLYKLLKVRKQRGLDWKRYATTEMQIEEKVVEIARLLNIHGRDTDRLRDWKWTKPTYYKYKKLYNYYRGLT